jgi:hypothetical protein
MTQVELRGGPEDGRVVTVGCGIEEFRIPVYPKSSAEGGSPENLLSPKNQVFYYKRLSPTVFGYIGVLEK